MSEIHHKNIFTVCIGDSCGEGIENLAKRNSDISLFIHNNQVFALTIGQFDAMGPKGFEEAIYKIEDDFPINNIKRAKEKVSEKVLGRVPLDVFYEVEKPTFESELWK